MDGRDAVAVASPSPGRAAPLFPAGGPPPSSDDLLVKFIGGFVERFAKAQTIGDKLRLYAELRDRVLGTADPQKTAEAIALFLASGQDAPTGLEFAVGQDGFLDTAPTIRTALLDMIADLHAGITLDLARNILDARTNPDEYALALRNMAWSPLFSSDAERDSELSQRFSGLLDTKEWLARPSVGFAEAFDVAVAMPNPQTVHDLASVAGLEDANGNRLDNGVSQAAIIALERVMLRSPKLLVGAFEQDPSFLSQEPMLRASLMARLDLRNQRQFDLFVSYLARSDHAKGELEFFGKFFPNPSYSFGPRLISNQEQTPSIAEMQQADRAFLSLLVNARSAGRLPDSSALQSILANLQRRVDEADQADKLQLGSVSSATPGPNQPSSAAVFVATGGPASGTGAPGRVRKLP